MYEMRNRRKEEETSIKRETCPSNTSCKQEQRGGIFGKKGQTGDKIGTESCDA